MEAEEQQTCPRRMSDWGPWERAENLDRWTTGHGVIGQDRVGLSCSFCGSLHPDRFMELVRGGWIVGPTDKSYKAYLGRPSTDEEKARKKAEWLNNFTASETSAVAEQSGKTPEQVKGELTESYDRDHAGPESCSQEAKFYFQHLSAEQRDEFIELHNARRMRIGYPGRLYTLPFFAGAGPKEG
jgi:hypothetical protein